MILDWDKINSKTIQRYIKNSSKIFHEDYSKYFYEQYLKFESEKCEMSDAAALQYLVEHSIKNKSYIVYNYEDSRNNVYRIFDIIIFSTKDGLMMRYL